MSQSRIEELRKFYLLDPDEIDELFTHIGTLTRERDELKAACEKVVKAHDPHDQTSDDAIGIEIIHAYIKACRTALAATASGKGGSS